MELEELLKERHLSASSVGTYVECGLLYKFSRIDNLEPEFSADALELGATVHRVLAYFHKARKAGKMPSLKMVLKRFETLWQKAAKESEDIQYKEGQDYLSLLEQGKGLLTAYYESFVDHGFEVVGVDEAFNFTMEGLPVPVVGIIDLIEKDLAGGIIIVYFKTSSRAYGHEEVDRNFQLTVYHLAARAMGYQEEDILLRLDCLIKTKKPRFEQYYTTRSLADEKRAVKKMREVWKGINQGIFVPNDTCWNCKGCAYKTHCDAWLER